MKEIAATCRKHRLKIHLDGARLFNALAETGDDPKEIGPLFDTLSFCLSKGLGAPIGSMLVSTKENIRLARRVRKVFGGGVRQAGFLAAAGIYALDHHMERLKDDHIRARKLGEVISGLPYVKELLPVETNIIVFTLADEFDSALLLDYLAENQVRAIAFGKNAVRFVTHLQVDDEMIERTAALLADFENG